MSIIAFFKSISLYQNNFSNIDIRDLCICEYNISIILNLTFRLAISSFGTDVGC